MYKYLILIIPTTLRRVGFDAVNGRARTPVGLSHSRQASAVGSRNPSHSPWLLPQSPTSYAHAATNLWILKENLSFVLMM